MEEYYKKRKGGGGVHGTNYQKDIIALFLLKAYESERNFKISSENLSDGKLDDVVLMDDKINILAQIKHIVNENEQIHIEALFSEEHVFSLISLLKSFKIKYLKHLKEINEYIQTLQNSTNINALKLHSRSVLEAFEKCCDSHEELFRELAAEIRELQDESLLPKIDWFEKTTTYLITNIELHQEAKRKYATEIRFRKEDFLYNGENQVYYKFNPDEILKTFESMSTTSDQNKKSLIFFTKCFFKHFQLVVLKDFVLRRNIGATLGKLELFTKGHWDLDTVNTHIHKKVEEWYLYSRGSDGYFLKRIHLEVFFCDLWSNLYVKELKKFENKFDFEITAILPKILNKQITMVKSPRYFLLMVKLQEKWKSEIEKGQMLFVNPYEDIQLQTCLVNSFIYHKYTHLICPLLPNKNDALEGLINEILPKLTERKYKKVIILSEIDLSINATQTMAVINDLELYSNLTLTGTRRLKSLGDMENYYVSRDFKLKYDYYSEEKFLKTIINDHENKFVLIIDGPGMGKTTLLNSLTCRINKMDNFWAINIELNRYTNLLKESLKFKNLQVEDFLPFIFNSTMQDIAESQIFTIPGVMFLMIDAVDEVSPKYTDVVLNCLKATSKKVAKIVVTAREHLKTKLSEALDVSPYTLELFSPKNQKKFIMSYWIGNLKLKDEDLIKKCETYCEKLLKHLKYSLTNRSWNVLGIPLQTRMVAEIFLAGTSSELKGCQQFLEGDLEEIIFPDNITLGKLYDLFLEKKKDIYVEEKCNTQGNVSAEEALKKEFNDYVNVCKKLAVRIIFDKKHWFHFNITNECINIQDENLYKIGLLILPREKWLYVTSDSSSEDSDTSSIADRPQFIHRTFTEYFAAKVISHKLFHYNQLNLEFIKFFVYEVLLKRGLVVVQQFIEYDLKNNWSLRTLSLSKLFSDVLQHTSINENQNFNFLASRGCLYILKLLLNNSQTVKEWINDTYDDDKENILHKSLKQIDIVELLVAHGADVNLKGMFNKTALHFAAENGYLKTVEYLVDKVDDIDATTEAGLTPLHEAIFNNHLQVIKCLIKHGASVTKRTGGGWTCLQYSALLGHAHLTKMFLEKGADINEQTEKSLSGRTALQIAIERKYYEICEILLENNINVNLKDDLGRGLWSYAVLADVDSITVLDTCEFVKNKSKLYNIQKDLEALVIAVESKKLKSVRYLLDQGFDINSKNQEGWTPLQVAVKKVYYDICSLLLVEGADYKIQTQDGLTILHLAAATGDLKMFKLVENANNNGAKTSRTTVQNPFGSTFSQVLKLFKIENNEDLSAKSSEGVTVLHLAAKSGHLELFEYIYKKLDTNFCLATSLDGKTILHYAGMTGDLELIKFIEKKFNIKFDNPAKNGENVLHIAVSHGFMDVIGYIIKTLKRQKVNFNFKSADGSLILYRPNIKSVQEITDTLLEAGVKKEAIGEAYTKF